MLSRNKLIVIALVVVAAAGAAFMLMKGSNQGAQQMMATQVKTMKAIKRDTTIDMEFTGTIKATHEVKVQAKVAGYIVEKYCKGGDVVKAGQPLYRIDTRKYEANLLNAKANLSKARSARNNSVRNLQRDEQLYASAAIAEQQVDNQRATVESDDATIESMIAEVQLAEQDLADCTIYAPMDGKLALDDVAIGTYVGVGNTPLVTIGSSDPVYVQWALSESDYVKFVQWALVQGDTKAGVEGARAADIHLRLTDGSQYPITGHITEFDNAMNNNTSSLSCKAVFDNPLHVLVPGMFARVSLAGETIKGAILVPQRAVQQLLSESFVMVVDNGKSKAVKVELGDRVGSYYIIKNGLTGNEEVVVEGLTTLTEGMPLQATAVTAEEMGFSFTDPDAKKNK